MDEHHPGFMPPDVSNITPGGMSQGALYGHADPRKKRKVVGVLIVFFVLPGFAMLLWGAVAALSAAFG